MTVDFSSEHDALEQILRHKISIYGAEHLQGVLDERNRLEAEVERLHGEFQERKLEMPAGKILVLSELFAECEQVLEEYKLYEKHPGYYPKSFLEEYKRLGASLPSRIENVLSAAPPSPPIGDTSSDTEEKTSVETEQQESIRCAAKAAEDVRNTTEYLRYQYGGMPPLGV